MTQRLNYAGENGQEAMKVLFGFSKYLSKSPLEPRLLQLLEYRVSQINGCAFCLDMHSKDLRHDGETEQRIYMISAWRETDLYTDREKAALAWAEAVTLLDNNQVSDAVYNDAKAQFSERELIDLSIAVAAINCFNRLNIAFKMPAGDYQPGQFAAMAG